MDIHFPSEGVNFTPFAEDAVPGQDDIENPFVRTTEKATQLGKQIGSQAKEKTLSNRKIVQLAVQDELAARVGQVVQNWDALDPEALAESIIDLEDRVAVLKDVQSPEMDKIRAQVRNMHFRYLFPVVSMLDLKSGGEGIEIPFAREVHNLADQVFKTQSVLPFQQLSSTQQAQVLRNAARVQ